MLDNLGTIEQRVYRTYWNDGLLDLFAALGILSIGVFWTLDVAVGAAITPAILIPLWAPCRKRFIEPRLGMVEFSDAREQRNTNLLKQVVVLGFGFLALGVAVYFLRGRLQLDPSVSLIAGLPAMLLGLLAVITTFLVATARFLVYAALLVAAGAVGALAGREPGEILVVPGVVMLLIAIGLLIRFFGSNPIVDEESP